MLNPFPIQFLSLFAYFILRLFLGGVLLYLGLIHWKHRKELSDVFTLSWWPFGTFSAYIFALGELLLASLTLLGAYTQYAMIGIFLMSVKMLVIRKWFTHQSLPPRMVYVLLLGAALTLFITGAGVLAVDLPV